MELSIFNLSRKGQDITAVFGFLMAQNSYIITFSWAVISMKMHANDIHESDLSARRRHFHVP